MSGFLVLLAIGAVITYAWPIADGWQTKFWVVFLAAFLMPVSWPWLIARGHRARRSAKFAKAQRAKVEAAKLRGESIEWWTNEYYTAWRDGDTERVSLALDVLAAMGARNPARGGTS